MATATVLSVCERRSGMISPGQQQAFARTRTRTHTHGHTHTTVSRAARLAAYGSHREIIISGPDDFQQLPTRLLAPKVVCSRRSCNNQPAPFRPASLVDDSQQIATLLVAVCAYVDNWPIVRSRRGRETSRCACLAVAAAEECAAANLAAASFASSSSSSRRRAVAAHNLNL